MASVGFFNKTPSVSDNNRLGQYIDVGGGQFRAVAVALIDRLNSANRINESTLKIILERFFTFFPQYKLSQAYLTLGERMKMLINSSRRSEVVECMAYVLRQLTVDALYADPLSYREVFEGLSPDTSTDYLRQPSVVLHVSAFAALAHAVDLKITLSFQWRGKELRLREDFSNESLPFIPLEVKLQVQDDHYFPEVRNKTDFMYVGRLAVHFPTPVVIPSSPEKTIKEILDLIATHNKELHQSYHQWCKNLFSMVAAGELTRQDLITLFIEFLPEKYNPSLTTGSTQFFSSLAPLENNGMVTESIGDSEQQIIELLVESLAGWISNKQLDADELVDFVEVDSRQRIGRAL